MARFREYLLKGLAKLWFRLDRRHRQITLRNLEFAFGEALSPQAREELALQVFEHFVRFFWEILELLLLPLARITERVIIVGQEHLQEVLARGRGVVAVTGHLGNWEYTAMAYGLRHQPLVVVGRDHDHPLMRRLIRHLRERGRNRMIPKQGGLAAMLAELRRNQIVCLVVDQNTTTKGGVLVDFFGHRSRTTPIAAILARRYKVPVLPVLSRRLADGRHLLQILPPLPHLETARPQEDVLQLVEWQSRIIEAGVRNQPNQWLWLHKRWKNQYPELYRGL